MSTETYLQQREVSRSNGDALAVSVRKHLQDPDALRKALTRYCEAEGWNGPAGSWVREPTRLALIVGDHRKLKRV